MAEKNAKEKFITMDYRDREFTPLLFEAEIGTCLAFLPDPKSKTCGRREILNILEADDRTIVLAFVNADSSRTAATGL